MELSEFYNGAMGEQLKCAYKNSRTKKNGMFLACYIVFLLAFDDFDVLNGLQNLF